MKNISLITVYNNQKLLDEMLSSARKQANVDIDYVMIENSNNSFSSAADALNYGTTKAKGEVFVYLHQDIEFLNDNALETIYDFAIEHKNTFFGAAGVKRRNNKSDDIQILASFFAGADKSQYKNLDEPTDCFTLDECLIACHRDCMKDLSFDDEVCDGWHLYGADLCLQVGLVSDLNVMVIPMPYVWHKSNGNADKSYRDTQDRLAKKYKGNYKIINTTNGYQYTSVHKRTLMNIYRKLRYRI
jgi:glycosyltransferase involved in cell wall biosynthesis